MAGTPQTPATALAAAHGAGSSPKPNADVTRRLNLVRRMAWLCAALMLATIVLSAFMRLSSTGLGCADWPACYGQSARETAAALTSGQNHTSAAGSTAVAVARVLHRIVASVVLILVITLTLATLATKPRLPREGPLSLALLLLALALAALGVVTAGATLPAVTLGNLMGGFVMLALCWRLAAAPTASSESSPPAQRGLGILAWLAIALLLAQVALGALLSGSYAALACQGLADCVQTAAASGWDWRALNPWQQPMLDATPPFNAAGALTHVAHRVGAALLLAVFAALAVAAWRRGRGREALVLLLLLALQALLGWAAVASGLPIALVLLHNLNAALMLALLAQLV